MKGTKVQTLGAVACACAHARVQDYACQLIESLPTSNSRIHCNAHASFVSAFALKMADCTYGRTTEGLLDLCSGEVSEKIFSPSLSAEYVTAFAWRTDAPKVRCDLTDKRQTDRQTNRPNYSNPRCACAPRVNQCKVRQGKRLNLINRWNVYMLSSGTYKGKATQYDWNPKLVRSEMNCFTWTWNHSTIICNWSPYVHVYTCTCLPLPSNQNFIASYRMGGADSEDGERELTANRLELHDLD